LSGDLEFIKNIGDRDHFILFYDTHENKHKILFEFLSGGLKKGRCTVYIDSDETPEQIRESMMNTGIDVPKNEAAGSLVIRDCQGWYIENGHCKPDRILANWAEAAEKSKRRGLKGVSAPAKQTASSNITRSKNC
jgi:hypothetical protein